MSILTALRLITGAVRPLAYPLMVGAGSCLVAAAVSAGPGRPSGDLPTLAELETEHARLDHLQRTVSARTALKDALVADLIDGRATLPQVAGEFAQLAAANPEQAELIARAFPGKTPGETAARNVLCLAENRLAMRPDGGEVQARLRREFAANYGGAPAP